MQSQAGFTLMDLDEFADWLSHQSVGSRTINHVQIHHTWLPEYANFTGQNHFSMQKGMKSYHMQNGFADIAQQFTIFPDGLICTGRPLRTDPAGIKGHNAGGICIENIGNYDQGHDTMKPGQRDAIIGAVARLCRRFSLPIDDPHIVYHHWFDAAGGRTKATHKAPVKTCPGTAFFGGNSEAAAAQNFYPLVSAELQRLTGAVSAPAEALGLVTVDGLNIREEPNASARIIGVLDEGDEVRIAATVGRWFRLTTGGNVHGQYVETFKRKRVCVDAAKVYRVPRAEGASEVGYALNEVVRVFEEVDGFSRVSTDQRWVKSSDLA